MQTIHDADNVGVEMAQRAFERLGRPDVGSRQRPSGNQSYTKPQSKITETYIA